MNSLAQVKILPRKRVDVLRYIEAHLIVLGFNVDGFRWMDAHPGCKFLRFNFHCPCGRTIIENYSAVQYVFDEAPELAVETLAAELQAHINGEDDDGRKKGDTNTLQQGPQRYPVAPAPFRIR